MRKKYTGCDEDCFHCPYSDCRKPASELKSDISVLLRTGGGGVESAPHMFTVELGGIGRNTPNISRKFYL